MVQLQLLKLHEGFKPYHFVTNMRYRDDREVTNLVVKADATSESRSDPSAESVTALLGAALTKTRRNECRRTKHVRQNEKRKGEQG
jgi:hypothetical protein